MNIHFEQAKPFFKALREHQSNQTNYRKALDKLTLEICSDVNVKMKYLDIECDYSLTDWGWIIQADVLYIKVPDLLIGHQSDLLAYVVGDAVASIFGLSNGGDFSHLFRCSKNERLQLLSKILGEDISAEQIDVLANLNNDDIVSDSVLVNIPVIQEPKLIVSEPPEKPSLGAKPISQNSFDMKGILNSKPKYGLKSDGKLAIIPIPVQPKSAPSSRKLSIKKVSRTGGRGSISYTPSSGDFYEMTVYEIEKSFETPRFPLRVGHWTGDLAFGCDILSFATKEACEQFESNENRDLNLVERFIEVKGRKDRQAEIELRGNEKKAAFKYGNKYYLYRISQISEYSFTLSILKNPLSDPEVVEHSVYLHLDRSSKKEEFEIFLQEPPLT